MTRSPDWRVDWKTCPDCGHEDDYYSRLSIARTDMGIRCAVPCANCAAQAADNHEVLDSWGFGVGNATALRGLRTLCRRVHYLCGSEVRRALMAEARRRIVEIEHTPEMPSLPTKSRRRELSARVRFLVLQRDGSRCRACGATSEDTKLHVDHIYPFSKGGSHDMSNLQTLCERCNLGKGALAA